FGVDTQLSKFPGTTYAFGSSAYNGNIYSAENGPVNMNSTGSGNESFVFLTSGSVNGQNNISTGGQVVVLDEPDDFQIPLFNQFQPAAEDEENTDTGTDKKNAGGNAAKSARVRGPRGSVIRRTRLDNGKECR
ncbi:MAG TPA: hypothetical protein VHE37_14890, partial [Nevskiaceae bacterium]|nr:hypothetical protein [Nevskiaceae bacterium]